MKVLLLNGSPHENGCVFTALNEIAVTLKENGIDSEIFWIGNQPVRGCVACWGCRQEGSSGCVFRDDIYLPLVEKVKECDGLIVGTPVYYAGPAGSLCALLDRLFFSASRYLRHKPAACVVNCRRGGASAAFDRLNKYFTINQMPVISSQYWNSTHGFTPDDVRQDLEGLQTMRTLARNMAYHLQTNAETKIPLPEQETFVQTNFIS
ncbi:MAG: flavodoxin family protein [Planctomycetaceae bacterium]|nr:flavodoxin family protein [Planctomycetaceae bacterium]MDO4425806.1 flavodoxin family protein [Planctomycetia bacterium]